MAHDMSSLGSASDRLSRCSSVAHIDSDPRMSILSLYLMTPLWMPSLLQLSRYWWMTFLSGRRSSCC